jgi:hypothetical protein
MRGVYLRGTAAALVRGFGMDRDEFLAQLDQLTPKEIEERLSSWDTEKLTLAHEYFAKQSKVEPPQTDRLLLGKGANNVVTERTMTAAVIALGLTLAALILRGGYEVAGSNVGAYVVNRFTGTIWQCLDACVRLETFSPEKKKK